MAVLLLPALVLFVLVSSQTALNENFRYVLPSFGFVFVFCGVLGTVGRRRNAESGQPVVRGVQRVKSQESTCSKKQSDQQTPVARLSTFNFQPSTSLNFLGPLDWGVKVLTAACLLWTVLATTANYPHSLAYFNELAGGAENGHKHLLYSNLDWGQDLGLVADLVPSLENEFSANVKVVTQVKYALGVFGMTPLCGREFKRTGDRNQLCVILVDRTCLAGGAWDKKELTEQIVRRATPIQVEQMPTATFCAFLFAFSRRREDERFQRRSSLRQ